uniref:F-ATPase gamma subunit n=1 Tax=Meloidogyne floridensis TaxID=298350 RepID=A0A915P7S4_9BILA
MFRAVLNNSQRSLILANYDGQRGFATLKDISIRLKSIKNIQKITKSMKMVSAAKYAKAERELKGARIYGQGAQVFFENLMKDVAAQKDDTPTAGSKRILVMVTSDRGLCANAILSSGYDFDGGDILYNQFKTVVSFETKRLPIPSLQTIRSYPRLSIYDSIDDDVLKRYVEYSLAQLIYYAMKESATSEQSSRMTAMDGASKNAGEMIDKLTLQFNRTRQAVITRELIEIISGAAAV